MGFCGGAASVILRSESIHQSSGLGLLAVWGGLVSSMRLGTGVTLAILALAVAGAPEMVYTPPAMTTPSTDSLKAAPATRPVD